MKERPTPRRLELAVGVCSTLVLLGCDRSEVRHAAVDEPMPAPMEVEGPPRPPDELHEPDPDLVAKCVRGTGRNADGNCEALRRFDAGYVQRVQLPSGDFVMGDIPPRYDASKTRTDPVSSWSGNPPRQAHVDAFWIDLHEVTRSAYEACVREGACSEATCPTPGDDPVARFGADEAGDVPQTCVTHAQAEAFCRARGGALPTEAQWEFAARGVDARIYPWGNDLRDEFRQALVPVGGPVDISYFGLRGMGTNAIEWVAESFELDAGLASFSSKPFRSPSGPLRRWRDGLGTAHVIKGGRAGARTAQVGADDQVGFRCAAPLSEQETPLVTPDPAVPVPVVASGNGVQFFGGVAEVATRDEAEAFCVGLAVEVGSDTLTGWRLPTFDEIVSNADVFRGPGPFWTAAGAAEQRGQGTTAAASDPWVEVQADPAEGLAARCARSS